MELEHSFTVPVPVDRAWDVLLDVERVAPCMPGASLDSVAGDEIKGRIKVKVGPISMTYAGTARFTERDAATGVMKLEAAGKETRGAGTASATVRSELHGEGDETHVVVNTSLNVTGRPAQFGRGVMADVGGKLIGIFAANLADMLRADNAAGSPADAGSASATAAVRRRPAGAVAAGTGRATAGPGRPKAAPAPPRGTTWRGTTWRCRSRNCISPCGRTTACGGKAFTRSATWPPARSSSCWPSTRSAPPRSRRSGRSLLSAACRSRPRAAPRPGVPPRGGTASSAGGRSAASRVAANGDFGQPAAGARPASGPGRRPAAGRGRHRPAERGRPAGAQARDPGAGRPRGGDRDRAAAPPPAAPGRPPRPPADALTPALTPRRPHAACGPGWPLRTRRDRRDSSGSD